MNENNNSQFLSAYDLEEQENLTVKDLRLFKNNTYFNDRPQSSFFELMEWTEKKFSGALEDRYNLNRFVHNKIIIDGQFMIFARENNIKITCLAKDSLISWRTDHDFEKYFVQGVFLICGEFCEFLHAALYHKGNQNEDEVSFFIICSEKNYDSYIKLRNKYEDWLKERDRDNLHIKVIDGEDIPYTKEHTWDDLYLPDNMKKEIKGLVENFLSSKDFYASKKIAWKRGILLFGKPGNGKTSIIRTLISNYNFKPITVAAGPNTNEDVIKEAFTYAEKQSPGLLYFEDLDSLLDRVHPTAFLNLMDGVHSKNGLFVVATANNIKKFKSNIIDRPSRFDRKFEIPLPNEKMSYIYLRKWFENTFSDSKYKEIAKKTVKSKFSYSHLKELYLSSMYQAIANNKKIPTVKDLDDALNTLIKDKTLLNDSFINMDSYLT